MRIRRSWARLLALGAGATLLGSVLSVVPAVVPGTPLTVTADAAGCLDENGHQVTCPISLDPDPLPVGATIGEQEMVGAFGGTSGARVQPYEWKTGSAPGRCLPNEAACNLTTQKVRTGSPLPPENDPSTWRTAAGLDGASSGDTSVTSGDLTGDGRDESVTAGLCPAGTGAPDEICLAVYDPATNAYAKPGASSWYRTGEYADTEGVGTIRVQQGLLLRRAASVVRAVFAVNDGADPNTGRPVPQGGVIATFTTDQPHGYVPGQPVRLANDPDLAAAMCPALEEGQSVLCGSDLSASWMPVLTVPSPTTFTLRIGVEIAQDPGTGDSAEDAPTGPQVPPAWPVATDLGTIDAPADEGSPTLEVVETGEPPAVPFEAFVGGEAVHVTGRTQIGSSTAWTWTLAAPTTSPHQVGEPVALGCDGCSVQATGIGPGVAMAWSAPGHVASVAAFSVRPGTRRPVRLLDDAPVGRLAQTAVASLGDRSSGQSVDGRDALDLAVADYDGDGQDEAAVVFAGTTSGVRLGMARFFGVSEGKQVVPLTSAVPFDATNATAPYSVSAAPGSYVTTSGSNTLGEDLAIGWGGAGHAFEVYDVSRGFALRSASLDDTARDHVRTSTGGAPAQWKPGTTYQAGDIIADPLGFWRATNDGRAACATDVPDATTFYFPLITSPLPNQPVDQGWNETSTVDLGLEEGALPTADPGPRRGMLEPAPVTVTAAKIPAYGTTSLPARRTTVVHGQYVSPSLAAQTFSGDAIRAFLQVAANAEALASGQLVVKVVSHDGTTTRGVLYSNLGETSAVTYPPAGVWADPTSKKYKAGTTRRFPEGSPQAFTPTETVQAEQGDRLVVEFGTILDAQSGTAVSEGIWTGTSSAQDLPLDESTQGGRYNPFIEFRDPVALDNCTTHFGDVGPVVWERVRSPRHVVTWAGPADSPQNVTASGASNVRLASGDFDADGVDEVVVADTRPGEQGNAYNVQPVTAQVWSTADVDCAAPRSPAGSEACPSAQGSPTKILMDRTAARTVDGSAGSLSEVGSAQVSVEVGRVGATTTGDPSFPNDVNPDVVMAWTCTSPACPSRTVEGGPVVNVNGGVEVQAFDVCVTGTDQDGDGVDDVCPTPDAGAPDPWTLRSQGSTATTTRFTFKQDLPAHDWNVTAFALPDIDLNSKTLGTPLEYLETGHVQPLMIVRSPPVHFDVFDATTGGEPGTAPDGKVDVSEIWDVNNCFTDYLATGEDYTCHTTSAYGTSTAVTSTLQGEVTNSGTTAGSGTVGLGAGFAAGGNCQRSSGEVHLADIETSEGSPGACIEGSAFLKLSGNEEQTASSSNEVGRTFSYTSTVTTSAGTDAVYAAVQQSEVLEYPVYAGSGFGFGAGVPIEYVTTKTPLRTRFQWSSSEDFNLPLTGQGHVPQDVLSYARTENQLAATIPENGIRSAVPQAAGWLEVETKDAPNLRCVQGSDPPDGTPVEIRGTDTWGKVKDSSSTSLSQYPCAVGGVPVEVQDTRTNLDRTYLVTQMLDATTLRLEPNVALPTGAPSVSAKGSLVIAPGSFPIDEWTVRRFHKLEAELVTNSESGFSSSYGWGFGAGLETGVNLDVAFDLGFLGFGTGAFSLGFEFSTSYTHNELQTVNVGTTQDTRFAVEVTGNIKPNVSYTIKPYLMQSPTGAMVLDWTTSPNASDTFWHTYYVDRGPNPGFALPDLLTPYKAPAPNSKPGATVPLLLRSSDFGGWSCRTTTKDQTTGLTSYSDCVPREDADPSQPLFLTATVHNYSLKAFDRSQPLKVRFYVGDPARGGWQIIDRTGPLSDPLGVDVPSVRSAQCTNRFCLPAQAESTIRVPWTWAQSYPGLAGRGRASDPLPIYAIIDPTNRVAPEVHDFSAPVEVRDCTTSYPTTANEYNSLCPTTDNEAYFTHGFAGTPAAPTDLSVRQPGDVSVNADGSIQVTVHAAPGTGRAQVRLYTCLQGGTSCVPQTLGSLVGTRVVSGFGSTATASVRFPSPGSGQWTVWAQAVPLDNFEPPGGGPFDAGGALRNNQVRTTLQVP